MKIYRFLQNPRFGILELSCSVWGGILIVGDNYWWALLAFFAPLIMGFIEGAVVGFREGFDEKIDSERNST